MPTGKTIDAVPVLFGQRKRKSRSVNDPEYGVARKKTHLDTAVDLTDRMLHTVGEIIKLIRLATQDDKDAARYLLWRREILQERTLGMQFACDVIEAVD
jgi:hypothetical protein